MLAALRFIPRSLDSPPFSRFRWLNGRQPRKCADFSVFMDGGKAAPVADGRALVKAVAMCGTSISGGAPKGFGDWKIPQWTVAMLPQARALTDRGEMRTRCDGVRLFCIMPLWGGWLLLWPSASTISTHYVTIALGIRGGGTGPLAGSLVPPQVGSNVPADGAVKGFRRHGAGRPRVGIHAYFPI
ncbi:hypothetical protein ACFQRK_23040 [Parapedobacter sp. GCM10030251]|uniref:hypothetical protein n=1 Tax=Parapedobacter sp. GCM10030251 TaxID=3273419 RepID=UPI00361A6A4E